jgi:acetyl esterase/lipase
VARRLLSRPTDELKNVTYAAPETGAGRPRLLDLYLPDDAAGPLPLIIWSSGSGWLRDDGKEGAADVAGFFTRAGYAVAGISVRSSAQAVFPAQVHDAKAAVRWLRNHADAYGIDPNRFAIMGYSSGGWLAAMVALTAGVHDLEAPPGKDDASSGVQAAVDFFGPTDFLQMDAHMPDGCKAFRAFLGIDGCHDDPGSPESRLVGGPIETRREACGRANPITYVNPEAPPFMILHGQADPFVPHHQSELLFDALRAQGTEAVFYSIPGVGHELPYVTDPALAAGYVVTSTSGPAGTQHPAPTWEAIEAFVADALRRSPGMER